MTAGDHVLPQPSAELERQPAAPSVMRPAGTVAVIVSRLSEAGRDRLGLAGVTALAGVLYFWNLTISGFANTYYAMAAEAGAADWRAFFFGSLDAGNFITLDKPPAATWLMSLSVRAFGLSSWSLLLPQALLGMASVALLYLAVRRSFGRPAAILAAIVLAVTPAATLIFRYDNPDALLTFVLVAAAWGLGRGLEAGRLRWVILAAALVGLGFLTKYLQAYLVLPAFATVWLISAPGSVRRRLGGLIVAGVTVLVTSGWWVAIVQLLPASSRPYVGGSTNNSVLELIFGYDGLGRIFGQVPGGGSAPSGSGPGPGSPFGGVPGILRMFNTQFGGEISWLIPLAVLALVVGLVIHRRTGRTDRRLAAYLVWGVWLLIHVAVFSLMSGIAHPYYSVMLAPAIGALVGAGISELWRLRDRRHMAGVVLAIGLVGTAAWAFVVLGRVPDFLPGLGIAGLVLALVAGVALVLPASMIDRRIHRMALALGLVAALAGSTAFTIATTSRPLAGGDPVAGPAGSSGGSRPVGDFGTTTDAALIDYLTAHRGTATWIVAAQGSGNAAAIQLAAGAPVLTMGGFSGTDAAPTTLELQALIASGRLRYVLVGGTGGPGGPGGLDAPGGPGGLLGPGGLDGVDGPDGPDGRAGPGGPGSGATAAWVSSACTAVSLGSTASGASGGPAAALYDCAGAS